MRLLHYLKLRNFKRYGGDEVTIVLDHPAVLIGPNNCGKTSAIQALALWSQGLRTWYDVRKNSKAKDRTGTALNRLNIVATPVTQTRFFWNNAKVQGIPLEITVGVSFKNTIHPVKLEFRHQGDEVVYCQPDEATKSNPELLAYAVGLNIELLYPMSGLETVEPILQPGRIDVLLGSGQTAQVLRNLCLMVAKNNPADWDKIAGLMKRLFQVELGKPEETARGTIELYYRQPGVKVPLDVSVAGRGFQQMLLIFAYLYSHKNGVLLVDEPDAHLEILRQKQVYVLLRDIASDNGSQVVLVTHSEVILDEALDKNLTLLLDGRADDLAVKTDIRNSLKNYGAEHYVKARERGYVLYVEGGTDIDILRAFAEVMNHRVFSIWDERINSFYTQNNHPETTPESELERAEGGFGIKPRDHFKGLKKIIPALRGLAILDADGSPRLTAREGELTLTYWKRYEAENYFVTPDLLRDFAGRRYNDMDLFGGYTEQIDTVLDALVLDMVFGNETSAFATWKNAPAESRKLIWEAKSERIKLSRFAEAFFEKLADTIGDQVLLRKGEFHRLIHLMKPAFIPAEVSEKLDLLYDLFPKAEISPANDQAD